MSALLPVIQFVRPHAKKRFLTVEVSDEAGAKFDEISGLGLRLTAEVIPGGEVAGNGSELEEQVCVAIENPDWGDYRMILAPNTPDGNKVVREVEEMILGFEAHDYHAWLADLQTDDGE